MATIICPYVFPEEIHPLEDSLWDLPCIFEQDLGKIGSDMMYQKLWNQTNDDIIILHSDMRQVDEDTTNNWYKELLKYANRYPEAGMLGCKLLYPAKDNDDNFIIQHAGGKFTEEGDPDHFGSGLRLEDNSLFKQPEPDTGQYDKVREVAWCTFGGIFIRRKVLDQVGPFDPLFEYTYERDVDYCLEARKLGWKIYMTPVTLMHWESKDNKRVMQQNLYDAQQRNRARLKAKWKDSELYATINKDV